MKYLLSVLILISLGTSGCHKDAAIQQAQTNALIQLIASGQWKMTSFVQGSTDVTSSFSNYKFQFKTDLTVDAILVSSGSVDKTGTWNADINSMTITSAFPSGNATLSLLNGTWLVTKNSLTYVEASQTVSGVQYTLRLDKL